MVRALSACKLSSFREGAQISGIWTCLLAVSFCSPYSHLCRLVSKGSRNQDGSPRCSNKALLGGADTSPLAGKVPGCLEPETGSVSEAVLLLPVPEAVSFCSPHSHLHRLVSKGSGNQKLRILKIQDTICKTNETQEERRPRPKCGHFAPS